MKLSIITPYHDTLKYFKELAKVLIPQLNNEVEWIIVDDGSNEVTLDILNAKVIHLKENSGNASIPRNIGLDNAEGEYIAFIDSDDLVVPNYIDIILNKINTSDFDYCYISWESKYGKRIIEDEPEKWNTCVWNCIYKKDLIGNKRFNPEFNIGEDKRFNDIVRKGKKENIKEILYFYNANRENSLTSSYRDGKIAFKKE